MISRAIRNPFDLCQFAFAVAPIAAKTPVVLGDPARKPDYGSNKVEMLAPGHRALCPMAVGRGVRTATFFRLRSMVRDAHTRSLTELATAIRALVQISGRADPETVE
jgi:hypothetical protein